MSAKAKRTRLTWHAISRSSTPIHLASPFSSPSRSVFLHLVPGQLPIYFRQSSCLWPENTTLRYPTWIAPLLQFDTTQHAIRSRHVHDVLPRDGYHNWRLKKAYMYLLLGNTHIESSDYESAIDLLERARAHVQPGQDRLPLVVSLVLSTNRSSATCRNRSLSLPTDVGMEI